MPGALLYIGDGHALQGDGELNGNALETSMDVEFTVNLLSGQGSDGPRAENDEYIMAMGIAGSLPDALRRATTSLARWLERDYHLTPNESAIVLGTSIRYDVAEGLGELLHVHRTGHLGGSPQPDDRDGADGSARRPVAGGSPPGGSG